MFSSVAFGVGNDEALTSFRMSFSDRMYARGCISCSFEVDGVEAFNVVSLALSRAPAFQDGAFRVLSIGTRKKSILLLSGFIAAVVLDKAHNLVRKGFPAGFAEMDMNVKGRAADVLHKVRFGGQGKRLRGVLVLLVSLFIGSPFYRESPMWQHMGRWVEG